MLFAWAAWKPQPTLVRAACSAWLLTAALHLGFHATHLDGFDTGDAVAELTSLAFLLVPPVVAIWAVAGETALSGHSPEKAPDPGQGGDEATL